MSRYDFIGNFNLKVAAKSVDDVLKYVKSKVSVINSRVNVVYQRAQINRIEQDFKQVNKQIKKTSELTDDLASIFANATRRFAGVSIATATLLSLVRGVKGAYKEVIQFEREMIRVAQAQDATIDSTKSLSKEISRLSVAYGINALELAKTGRVLAQAGFNTKTTTKALEILAKINLAGTFGDAAENVEGMISILQQFGKEARASGTEAQFLEEKFNIINKISKKYAVESSDIITAVSKAGGSFETAGGSLEEFIASITAVRSATRESAATIANGFKTIFTRLQREETIESLRDLGVELVNAEGKFVGPIEALERLGRTLSVLDKNDVRFTQIAEEVGGIYQVNRLITLLKQQDVVQRALNDTKNASSDIDKDVEKGLQSTASKLDRLSASFQDLIKTYAQSDSLKQFVDLMISMGNTAIATAKALEPLLPLIGAAASLQGIILGGKITKKLFGFAKDPKSVPTIATNNYATGGVVSGGKGKIDDIPAMLTRGEFVVNKTDAQKNKALLYAINSGQGTMFAAKGGSTNKIGNSSSIGLDILEGVNNPSSASAQKPKTVSPSNSIVPTTSSNQTPYYGVGSASYITGTSTEFSNLKYSKSSRYRDSMASKITVGQGAAGEDSNSAYNQINSLGSSATKKELDNSLDLYTKLIKKGMDPQKALNHSIEKLASDMSKRTNTKEDSSPNLASPYYGPNTARDKRLEYMKSKGMSIPSGDNPNIPRSPNGPVGPVGPNGRGPGGPNGPNNPPGGPPNDPTKPVADASNKLTDVLSRFGGSALLAVGGIALLGESMGQFDASISSATGSFAAGFGSVYLTLGTMTDSLSSFAKNMGGATAATKAAEVAQKASTVSEMQETIANQQAVVSETMETAANQKSAVSGLAGSMGKMGGGVSKAINGLTSLTLGLSVAAGLYSAVNSLQSDYINKLQETNDKIINRAREGKSEKGDDARLKQNIGLQGDAIGRNDKLGGTVGVGSVAGTLIGGFIGSVFPVVGTAIGAGLGAVIGSGVGYAFNQLTGYTDSYVKSLQIATGSQYRAAQSSASLDRTLKKISTNGLTASQATSLLNKELKDAKEGLRKSRQDTFNTDIETSKSSGYIDSIGTFFGAFKPGAKSESQQKIFEDAKAAEKAQKEVVARAAEANNANIKDVAFEKINKASNSQELDRALLFLQSQAEAIKQNTIDSSTETDDIKKQKEGEDAKNAVLEIGKKNAIARNEEVSRINAAKIARELELEAIKKTTATLLSLSDKTNNLNIASALFDQVTTGFSKSVSSSRFSDISNIKDVGAFEKDARSVGSNLGQDGQDIANSVVLGVQAISELRKNLTSTDSAEFDKLRDNGLKKETNASRIEQILADNSKAFSRLSSKQRESIVNNVQSKFTKDQKFDADSLDKVINETTSMFQREADALGKQADLTNEQVERIRATNQVLQEAYIKNAELQIGLVDVQQRGQDRLSKVFDAVLTGSDRNALLDNEEKNRTKKANIALNGAGVGNIAGNTGVLSRVLQDSQARRARNDNALQGESNMAARSALNTENQRLDAAIKATTDELNRLANQSERAAGVMSKIDREQAKRGFIASKAEAFITGGAQDRAKAQEQESAVNLAMMTGTLQNLPADLKKSTLDEIRERAKLDDTGQTQKYLDRILSNDARNPAERAALLNVPTTKEQQLINDLRGIAAEETKAQQLLITAQNANTTTMTELLTKVNTLLGQPRNNAPIQPIAPGQGIPGRNAPVNPMINGGVPQQFPQNQQLNGGMNTVADNITKMTTAISGMRVDHQINVNGQINVGGLNLKNIEVQLAKGLEGYIVQKVTETINNSKKGFQTG